MSLCPECGNILVVQSCSPICLVCQHAGRGQPVTATEVKASIHDAMLQHAAAGLDAVYAALARAAAAEEEDDPAATVLDAQQMLRHRIRNPEHRRERPDWEAEDQEQKEREDVCQSCNGTGRWMNRHCPDCYEPDERE